MKRFARVAGVTAALTAVGALVERYAIAAPHYRGPRSDHFDGRRFLNEPGGWEWRGGAAFLKWQFTRERGRWRDWVDGPVGPPPEKRVSGARLRVTLINHATMLLQMHGMNILTDPIYHRTPIFTLLGNAALLERYDIDGVTELDWWQKSAPAPGAPPGAAALHWKWPGATCRSRKPSRSPTRSTRHLQNPLPSR